MKPVRLGILGLGTVGCGVIAVLRRNADEIARRAGRRMELVRVCARDLSKPRPVNLDGIEKTEDPFAVVRDDSINVVVELIGGVRPALDLVTAALASGKHLVTANKALIALHGNTIFRQASEKKAMVAFEAAVAGGVPVIKTIREGLSGNKIQWLAGIINGTGNYVLTEMRDRGGSFEDAVANAQMLGFAEADPRFDVDGVDAAHKLTIMASVAFGIPLQYDKVYIEGINGLDCQDIVHAAEFGCRVKHLGIARRSGTGIELRVHPALVPQSRLIANVEGAMNAVVINGDAVGSTLYYGMGAGAEPTASAVIADLVDVVRMMTSDPENRVPHLAFQPDALEDIPIVTMDDVMAAYYLRLMVADKVGVLAKLTQIIADCGISVEAVSQKEPYTEGGAVPLVFMTHKVAERKMNRAISQMEQLDEVLEKVIRIRVETFE